MTGNNSSILQKHKCLTFDLSFSQDDRVWVELEMTQIQIDLAHLPTCPVVPLKENFSTCCAIKVAF